MPSFETVHHIKEEIFFFCLYIEFEHSDCKQSACLHSCRLFQKVRLHVGYVWPA